MLRVIFYRSESGAEPVREWLKELQREDRKTIGRYQDRSVRLAPRHAAYPEDGKGPLGNQVKHQGRYSENVLHGRERYHGAASWVCQKSQETPLNELQTARRRLRNIIGVNMKNKHLGGNFDDFLKEQDLLAGAKQSLLSVCSPSRSRRR